MSNSQLLNGDPMTQHTSPPDRPHAGSGGAMKFLIFFLVLALGAGLVIFRGIRARANDADAVKTETAQLAAPAVTVIHPKLGNPTNEVILSGGIQAYSDAPIYARASGYVGKWNANLGDEVKEGQELAEIVAPELDLQITQAKASLQQARSSLDQSVANLAQGKANEDLAKITADRWKQLSEQGIASRQDYDQRDAQYKALVANTAALEEAIKVSRGNIAALEANVAVLDQTQSYRIVRAPFDGVVTARNTDVGALVNSGNAGNTVELFHIAATKKLRVFVSVPEVYSRSAVPGVIANLSLDEFPNRTFSAKLVRTSGAIDATTRTLLSEFEIDNSTGLLRPGSYAEVHFGLQSPAHALLVSVSAVMFRPEGSVVGVVEGNRARLAPVKLGKDYGKEIEVVSGITENDNVIENPPDSLTNGMIVRVGGGAPARPQSAP